MKPCRTNSSSSSSDEMYAPMSDSDCSLGTRYLRTAASLPESDCPPPPPDLDELAHKSLAILKLARDEVKAASVSAKAATKTALAVNNAAKGLAKAVEANTKASTSSLKIASSANELADSALLHVEDAMAFVTSLVNAMKMRKDDSFAELAASAVLSHIPRADFQWSGVLFSAIKKAIDAYGGSPLDAQPQRVFEYMLRHLQPADIPPHFELLHVIAKLHDLQGYGRKGKKK